MNRFFAGIVFAGLAAALLPVIAMTQVSNQAAIERRQADFKEMKDTVVKIKDAIKAKDLPAVESAAGTILANAKELTGLFPEGSYEGDTRAKEKIWENLDDFQERQQSLISHAEALITASQGDDIKAVKTAFKTMSKDCKGCHMRYRQIF